VVQVSSTVFEDSSSVELPVAGINGNTDGLFIDGGSQLIITLSGYIGISRDRDNTGLSIFAGSISSGIRIGGFGGQTVFLNILEGTVH